MPSALSASKAIKKQAYPIIQLNSERSWLLLSAAVESNDHQELIDLLKAGADANAKRPKYKGSTETLLHFACKRGSALSVETLLAYGASPQAIAHHPMLTAGKAESVAHGVLDGVYRSGRTEEASSAALKKMRALIAAGLRHDMIVEGEKTLWQELIETPASRTDLLIPWINAGADPDELIEGHATLLFKEVAAQNVEFVALLLQAGADPDKKRQAKDPISPLDAAVMFTGRDASEIAQLLLAESERRQISQVSKAGGDGNKPRL